MQPDLSPYANSLSRVASARTILPPPDLLPCARVRQAGEPPEYCEYRTFLHRRRQIVLLCSIFQFGHGATSRIQHTMAIGSIGLEYKE